MRCPPPLPGPPTSTDPGSPPGQCPPAQPRPRSHVERVAFVLHGRLQHQIGVLEGGPKEDEAEQQPRQPAAHCRGHQPGPQAAGAPLQALHRGRRSSSRPAAPPGSSRPPYASRGAPPAARTPPRGARRALSLREPETAAVRMRGADACMRAPPVGPPL